MPAGESLLLAGSGVGSLGVSPDDGEDEEEDEDEDDDAAAVEDEDEEEDESAGFVSLSADGLGGGISGPPGEGISYGVELDFELSLELLDEDELGSAFAFAAGFLAAALAFAAGLAAWADGPGSSIVAGNMARAVNNTIDRERLEVMAVLSNAKVANWSSTASGDFVHVN